MSYIPRHSRLILIGAAVALAAGYIIIFPDIGDWIRPAPPIAPPDVALGSTSARIHIIEVSSPTCQECARFHREVFPLLLREYVSTGKVRYSLRILPVSPLDFAAASIAGCVHKNNYLAFWDLLFRKQPEWTSAPNLDEKKLAIAGLGQTAGLTPDKARECMENKGRAVGLQLEAQSLSKRLGKQEPPALIINGKTYKAAMEWTPLKKILQTFAR